MKLRLLLSVIILYCVPIYAETITGKVVGVTDGDTLTILTGNKRQVKVRLAEIDAPESRQPYGAKAKQELSNLAFSKEARIEVQDTDRYGRTVGRAFVGDVDINLSMIDRGAAWVYRKYSHDPQMIGHEAQAKSSRRGLWSLPESDQTPPWEWRRGDNKVATVAAPKVPAKLPTSEGQDAPGGACGGKSTCKQMASCAEAQHYLDDCGLSKLDRDRDGVPCESLCGK